MKKLLMILLVLGTGLSAGGASASMLLQEDFDYVPGTLLTANGWTAHSGAGTNAIPVTASGLSYSGYPGSGIGNAASMLTTGEDDNRTYTVQSSGAVYYAFLAQFSAAQATGDYFTHFGTNPWTTGFYGRVFCKLVAGSLNFGVTKFNGTAVYSAAPYPLNTTHLIVVKYTFVPGAANDTADLWVDPMIGPAEPSPLVSAGDYTLADAAGIGGVGLRQGSAANAPTQWVDGIRIGTNWADVVAGLTVGACCTPEGGCTVTEQFACSAPNIWHPEWTTCSPNPCPVPQGACCAPDGVCTITVQSACAAPNAWHPEWTSCAPNPCPQPLGACCHPDGTCSYVPQAECLDNWLGIGSVCDPNPCQAILGACCAPEGTCVVSPEASCAAPSIWHPEWTSCAPNPCPQPAGACCFPEGTCTFVLQADCQGTWLGYGSVCDPNPCPQPSGACCFPDGTCTFVPQAQCTAIWLGYGTSCTPNPCPRPGACCLPNTDCQVLMQAACLAAGGTFMGDGTVCNPYPCPVIPVNLCQVRENDANGVPLMLNKKVEFEAIALVPSGLWNTTTQDFQCTDGNCCVDIFGGSINPVVQIGDRVHVVGTVIQYNGKTEISNPGLAVTILSSGNPIPAPMYVSTFDLSVNGENYESCLIGVHCVRIVGGTWPASGANSTLQIDDGSGPVDLFIDKDTNIDGSPAPTVPFSIVGISSQFDSSSPYTAGYEIVPRALTDLIFNCQGACCFHDGSCLLLTEADCAAQSGVYSGNGTVCDPNPCEQPRGACCDPATGNCTLTIQAGCLPPNTWMGMDTVCDPNPCALPLGACCTPVGACTMTYELGCTAPNIWHGEWSTCNPNPCPQPLGACCASNGSCMATLQADCVTPSYWVGPLIPCDPNPCVQPVAACCYPDGQCQLATSSECQAPGVWHPEWVTCDPNPCTIPMGACCAPNGVCNYVPESQCLPPNTYMNGQPCEPNPCPQPTGACCAPDGVCTVTTQAGCPAPGVWQGPGTLCEPNPCPQPVLGACCLSTGECVVTSQPGCAAIQGTYQGDNTSCTPNPCPPPVPTERSTWGRIKNQYR